MKEAWLLENQKPEEGKSEPKIDCRSRATESPFWRTALAGHWRAAIVNALCSRSNTLVRIFLIIIKLRAFQNIQNLNWPYNHIQMKTATYGKLVEFCLVLLTVS